jgi:hypothetical protein
MAQSVIENTQSFTDNVFSFFLAKTFLGNAMYRFGELLWHKVTQRIYREFNLYLN